MRKTLVALALVSALAGCNDDNPEDAATTPTAATEATIALVSASVSPILVPPVATGDPDFPWQITWVTTVRETAGVSARVDRISVVLVDLKLVYEGADLTALGSTAVAANGSASFNLGLQYALADGGRQAVVSVIVDLTDSRGNHVQSAAQLRIL